MKFVYRTLIVTLLAAALIACGSDNNVGETDNIVEVAEANGSFTILVAALKTEMATETMRTPIVRRRLVSEPS